MRYLTLWAAAVALTASCDFAVPSGRFGCDDTTDCPPGQSCREGLCFLGDRDAMPDADASDADINDADINDADIDGATGDADSGEDGGGISANFVFITSREFLPTELSREFADGECNRLASAAGLPGRYIAWLGTPERGPRARLMATGARGWVRVDGLPVADRVEDLVAGRLYHPISIDEEAGFQDSPVLTATTREGNYADTLNCGNFLDATGEIATGSSLSTTMQWMVERSRPCSNRGRLYCFGTEANAPVAPDPPTGPTRLAFLSTGVIGPGPDGIARADMVCQTDANIAGRRGSFIALLPDGPEPAIERLDLSGPMWHRLDGVPLAANMADFASGNFRAPLNQTLGTNDYVSAIVWTFGSPNEVSVDQCMSFASTTDPNSVMIGFASFIGPRAFGSGSRFCDELLRVRCFEE
ncbi:MAG: hypothetical protein AAGF12_00915 [Myxococcota bacterium]